MRQMLKYRESCRNLWRKSWKMTLLKKKCLYPDTLKQSQCTVVCIWEFTLGWPGSRFLLPFLSLWSWKGVQYLFKKPKAILNESSNRNLKYFIHNVSKLVRMKEPLFHSNQSWHTGDEAFPILIAAINQNCFELSKEICDFFVIEGA